jgi:hypothetical protein
MKLPRFLDTEASSLNRDSYPIEIAWSNSVGTIESHLINPYSVEKWTDWDFEAQSLHGINRKQCREEGVHPRWLCDRMRHSITPGEIIYADGGPFDRDWVDELYANGSALGFAQFRVEHSDAVMLPLLNKVEKDNQKRWQLYNDLKLDARKKVGVQHRAAVDVQYLIELYGSCLSLANSNADL